MLLGALIGAAIGFSFLGPVGLLLGGVVGLWGMQLLSMLLLKGRLGTIRQQFLDATFAVMGALCKADGQVTENEIAVAQAMFDRLRLNKEQRAHARNAFRRGKQPGFDLDAEVAMLARVCRGQRALEQMFLQVQFAAVAADGRLHPAEREMLLRIARGLGLSDNELRQIEAMLGAGAGTQHGDALGAQSGGEGDLEQAYAVLGVSADASNAEIKKAYRRQMSRNHPDKLAGRGLPESMRDMAAEKTRKIGAAYERIQAARGLS